MEAKNDIQTAADYCNEINQINEVVQSALKLEEETTKKIGEVGENVVFSKDFNFEVMAMHNPDVGYYDLEVERVEIVSQAQRHGSNNFFFFLLHAVIVTTDGKRFWFMIAKTKNISSPFYLVSCEEEYGFTLNSAGGTSVKFSFWEDLIAVVSFCYESIDAFNKKLEIKLEKHLDYLCKTPLPQKSDLPASYLEPGVRVGIFDEAKQIGQAIIVSIEDTSTIFYSITKKIVVKCFDNSFPDRIYRFGFITKGVIQKEGWHLIDSEGNYKPEGPAYEIKAI